MVLAFNKDMSEPQSKEIVCTNLEIDQPWLVAELIMTLKAVI